MRILAFWAVNSKFGRHDFETYSEADAFGILYHKRDELGTKLYDLDARNYNDSMWQHEIGSMSDFEDDYNNEDLDGGFWCNVLELDEDYVRQIVEE